MEYEMNQRLRELNMQAAEYATSVCPTHSRDWYPIQNTKFAELIIQECIDIANDTRYDGKVVANRIKFVFGVEE